MRSRLRPIVPWFLVSEQAYVCTATRLFPCPTAEGLFLLRAEIDCPPITKHPTSCSPWRKGAWTESYMHFVDNREAGSATDFDLYSLR